MCRCVWMWLNTGLSKEVWAACASVCVHKCVWMFIAMLEEKKDQGSPKQNKPSKINSGNTCHSTLGKTKYISNSSNTFKPAHGWERKIFVSFLFLSARDKCNACVHFVLIMPLPFICVEKMWICNKKSFKKSYNHNLDEC